MYTRRPLGEAAVGGSSRKGQFKPVVLLPAKAASLLSSLSGGGTAMSKAGGDDSACDVMTGEICLWLWGGFPSLQAVV